MGACVSSERSTADGVVAAPRRTQSETRPASPLLPAKSFAATSTTSSDGRACVAYEAKHALKQQQAIYEEMSAILFAYCQQQVQSSTNLLDLLYKLWARSQDDHLDTVTNGTLVLCLQDIHLSMIRSLNKKGWLVQLDATPRLDSLHPLLQAACAQVRGKRSHLDSVASIPSETSAAALSDHDADGIEAKHESTGLWHLCRLWTLLHAQLISASTGTIGSSHLLSDSTINHISASGSQSGSVQQAFDFLNTKIATHLTGRNPSSANRRDPHSSNNTWGGLLPSNNSVDTVTPMGYIPSQVEVTRSLGAVTGTDLSTVPHSSMSLEPNSPGLLQCVLTEMLHSVKDNMLAPLSLIDHEAVAIACASLYLHSDTASPADICSSLASALASAVSGDTVLPGVGDASAASSLLQSKDVIDVLCEQLVVYTHMLGPPGVVPATISPRNQDGLASSFDRLRERLDFHSRPLVSVAALSRAFPAHQTLEKCLRCIVLSQISSYVLSNTAPGNKPNRQCYTSTQLALSLGSTYSHISLHADAPNSHERSSKMFDCESESSMSSGMDEEDCSFLSHEDSRFLRPGAPRTRAPMRRSDAVTLAEYGGCVMGEGDLVGRSKDVTQLVEAMKTGDELIVVAGLIGVGKNCVAQEGVIYALQHHMWTSATVISLRGHTTLDSAIYTIASILRIPLPAACPNIVTISIDIIAAALGYSSRTGVSRSTKSAFMSSQASRARFGLLLNDADELVGCDAPEAAEAQSWLHFLATKSRGQLQVLLTSCDWEDRPHVSVHPGLSVMTITPTILHLAPLPPSQCATLLRVVATRELKRDPLPFDTLKVHSLPTSKEEACLESVITSHAVVCIGNPLLVHMLSPILVYCARNPEHIPRLDTAMELMHELTRPCIHSTFNTVPSMSIQRIAVTLLAVRFSDPASICAPQIHTLKALANCGCLPPALRLHILGENCGGQHAAKALIKQLATMHLLTTDKAAPIFPPSLMKGVPLLAPDQRPPPSSKRSSKPGFLNKTSMPKGTPSASEFVNSIVQIPPLPSSLADETLQRWAAASVLSSSGNRISAALMMTQLYSAFNMSVAILASSESLAIDHLNWVHTALEYGGSDLLDSKQMEALACALESASSNAPNSSRALALSATARIWLSAGKTREAMFTSAAAVALVHIGAYPLRESNPYLTSRIFSHDLLIQSSTSSMEPVSFTTNQSLDNTLECLDDAIAAAQHSMVNQATVGFAAIAIRDVCARFGHLDLCMTGLASPADSARARAKVFVSIAGIQRCTGHLTTADRLLAAAGVLCTHRGVAVEQQLRAASLARRFGIHSQSPSAPVTSMYLDRQFLSSLDTPAATQIAAAVDLLCQTHPDKSPLSPVLHGMASILSTVHRSRAELATRATLRRHLLCLSIAADLLPTEMSIVHGPHNGEAVTPSNLSVQQLLRAGMSSASLNHADTLLSLSYTLRKFKGRAVISCDTSLAAAVAIGNAERIGMCDSTTPGRLRLMARNLKTDSAHTPAVNAIMEWANMPAGAPVQETSQMSYAQLGQHHSMLSGPSTVQSTSLLSGPSTVQSMNSSTSLVQPTLEPRYNLSAYNAPYSRPAFHSHDDPIHYMKSAAYMTAPPQRQGARTVFGPFTELMPSNLERKHGGQHTQPYAEPLAVTQTTINELHSSWDELSTQLGPQASLLAQAFASPTSTPTTSPESPTPVRTHADVSQHVANAAHSDRAYYPKSGDSQVNSEYGSPTASAIHNTYSSLSYPACMPDTAIQHLTALSDTPAHSEASRSHNPRSARAPEASYTMETRLPHKSIPVSPTPISPHLAQLSSSPGKARTRLTVSTKLPGVPESTSSAGPISGTSSGPYNGSFRPCNSMSDRAPSGHSTDLSDCTPRHNPYAEVSDGFSDILFEKDDSMRDVPVICTWLDTTANSSVLGSNLQQGQLNGDSDAADPSTSLDLHQPLPYDLNNDKFSRPTPFESQRPSPESSPYVRKPVTSMPRFGTPPMYSPRSSIAPLFSPRTSANTPVVSPHNSRSPTPPASPRPDSKSRVPRMKQHPDRIAAGSSPLQPRGHNDAGNYPPKYVPSPSTPAPPVDVVASDADVHAMAAPTSQSSCSSLQPCSTDSNASLTHGLEDCYSADRSPSFDTSFFTSQPLPPGEESSLLLRHGYANGDTY